MSVAGGLPRAVERAIVHRCDALQIFAKNANQWRGRLIPRDEIREEVAPRGDESILPRTTYSPFADPGFAEALRAPGRDTLLVAGMLANMSVWQTAREAADRGF